jgi:hypothetical protein
VLARLAQRAPQGHLAAHLAAQHQLGLGQPQVGRQDVVVDGVHGLGLARQHVGDGGRGVGRDVEVVREVALGVQVHREYGQADAAEDVGERPGGRGLPGAALLGQDRDGGGQGRDDT